MKIWMTDDELDPIVEAAGLNVQAWRECAGDGGPENWVFEANDFLAGSGIVVEDARDADDYLEWLVIKLP